MTFPAWKTLTEGKARLSAAIIVVLALVIVAVLAAPAPPLEAQDPTNDATLRGLSLTDVTLSPTFDSATQSYTASVDNGVTSTTVTADATNPNSTVMIKLDGTVDADGTVDLAVGANTITMEVTAADGATMETYTVTVTRDVAVRVSIEAQHESIGGGLEDLVFTLTRTGATTEAMDVSVNIVQAETWLDDSVLTHVVTIPIGEATKDLTIAAWRFSFAPTASGNLTATASVPGIEGGSDTVQIISTAEAPITVSYDMTEYTFKEDAADAAVYVVATLNVAYPRAPSRDVEAAFSSRGDTAESLEDYSEISELVNFSQSEYSRDLTTDPFVARKPVPGFAIVNDSSYEGAERFGLIIQPHVTTTAGPVQFRQPDGTTCVAWVDCPVNDPPRFWVTITDEEDLPELSLTAAPAQIAEEDDVSTTGTVENVSTVTVSITNAKTFALDQTITLTFSGSAIEGTHYSVPEHQVTLPAGDSSVAVTVTATANTTADGNRTVTVDAARDGTSFGSESVTIVDNETSSLVLSESGLTVDEDGSGEFTVRLSRLPTVTVTVTVESDDTGAATVSPGSLTFTTTGWSTPSTVTVSGVEDLDNGDEDVTVSLSATGGDYAGKTAMVSVVVTDNDAVAMTVPGRPTNLRARASGQTIGLTWNAPSSDGGSSITGYRIEVSTDNGNSWSDLATTGANTHSYGHAGLSAGTTRHYRVSAVNAVGAGNPSNVANTTTELTTVNVPSVMATVSSVNVDEGSTATFDVYLATQPSRNVTVTVTSSDTSAVSVQPARLSFSTTNWDRPQTVTVRGKDDDDSIGDTATVRLAASGGEYDNVSRSVTVKVTDLDACSDRTAAEFSADRHTLGMVDIGRSVCSQIGQTYDIDWFAVDLAAGKTYVIDLEGRASNAGTLFDPILSSVHITRADTGRGVAQVMGSPRAIWDDNDGEGRNSRLMFTVVESGRYYIAVRGFASHTGTYALTVNHRTLNSLGKIVYPNGAAGAPLILLRAAPAPDPGPLGPDMPDNTETTATVIVNGVNNDDPYDDGRYHGQIDTRRDSDWIRVWLKANRAYVIHMLGAGNAWTEDENSWLLTLPGPRIGGVFRVDRQPGDPHPYGLPGTDGLPTADQWAAGPQSAAYFTPSEMGWHYIKVQAQSVVQTGTYAVHVFNLAYPEGAPAPAPTWALSTAERHGQPQGLTGTVAHNVVSLTWDDPDDASITGYQILRRDRDVHAAGDFQVHVDDTGSAAASYVDRDVEAETRYVYRIKARNAEVLSARSKNFNANTPPAPDPAPNNPATGAPTITGTARVGETLTANTSNIQDADGLVNATFTYQWIVSLGTATADIPGATDSIYTLAASDKGVAIKVRVSFTDDAGNPEALTSAATEAVGPPGTLKATEGEPLTASFALAPEAHDGENGFKLRIAFSDDVEITPEDMRDHALLVSGGTVTDAASVKGRSDLWELTVEPAGPGPVSILAPLGRACTDPGALCTTDGRSLTVGTILMVPGPPADNPPGVPDQPEGTVVFNGGVDLEWNDVPGADSYDVQLGRGGQWTALPADDVEIAFYGAGAIISGLDPEASLWFRVRAANGHGVSDWSEMLFLNSTSQFKKGRKARPDNAPASGAPVVHGTAQVGESLWADASGIEDGNGLDRVQFRYQWTSNDGSADTDIAGATDSGYTLAAADVGRTIKVRVAFTDRRGYSETRTSAATDAVEAAPQPDSPATGQPTITGTAQVGETLTADTSGIADADGLVNATYRYQWIANDGSSDTDITDATGYTYTLVADDVGRSIKVRVTVTDDAGNETTLTSAATDEVDFAVQQQTANSSATGQPTITGTAQVGETLTVDISGIADADGLVNPVFSYQWLSDDTEIGGATGSTYTLTASDEGKTIKVWVSFTDNADNAEMLTSAATGAVAAADPPAKPTGLSAAAVSHDAVTLTWDDPQDDAITGYVILRRDRAIHPVRTFVTIKGDTGSADTTYTDDTVEPEKQYNYKIKAINEHGEVSERSHWVRADTPEVPVPDQPTGLSAAVSHDAVTLTWDDPQDDAITGYVILRRDRAIHPVGTFVTIAGDTGSADRTYTDATVEPEKEYVYKIKAINEHGGVSEKSDWVRGFTPAAPAPGG